MKEFRKFSLFQVRWKEELKQGETTYLYRWTILFGGFSIRLHHWISSDVGPHLHDHPFNFYSFLFWGSYKNITETGTREIKAPTLWFANGESKHRLEIPSTGAWTILFCGRPYRKWGFWVNNHLWRPLRYFSKYGH
jgi:hypothetical protein